MAGRLSVELLERVEALCDRVLDVADALLEQGRYRRLVEQIAAAGTSVGANSFEADEAMSRADFCKTLAIVIKELNETRFWLRLIGRRGWIPDDRLEPLLEEVLEIKLVFGSMLHKARTEKQKAAANA